MRTSGAGPGASVLFLGVPYLRSSVVFACAGFTRRGSTTIVRSVVAAMGSFFLLSGLLVALAMGILGFPFEGRGWEGGLAHGAFGGVATACAALLPCDDEESTSR